MKQGFTLIEIVIYFALVSLVLGSVTTFTWNLIQDQQKQSSLAEVNDNAEFVIDKVGYYTRRANKIHSNTEFGTEKGQLVLTFPSSSKLTIDTYQTQVNLEKTSVTTTKLRYQRSGKSAYDLTSDLMKVKKFKLTDRSNSSSDALQVNLKLSRLNPANSNMYEAVQTFQAAFTTRLRQ